MGYKHGMNGTRTHRIWAGMRSRCNDANNQSFPDYGGRGISVCARWDDFRNFLEDMGAAPDGYTIERRDNSGNYEPGNCRWATYIEQANNRRSNAFLTYKGETLTIAQWAAKLKMDPFVIYRRNRAGKPIEQIFQKKHLVRTDFSGLRKHDEVRKAKTHCVHGHELSGDNLYMTPAGTRSCKYCRNQRSLAWNRQK